MKPDILPDHPAFLRLQPDGRIRLAEAAEFWEAPEGAVIHYPGDPGEDLLFLVEGRLESSRDGETVRRWFPGDLWGESHPFRPRPVEGTLTAAVPSRWLRWPGETIRFLLETEPGISKALAPVRDGSGTLISGLPDVSETRKGPRPRRFRPSLRPVLVGFAASIAASCLLIWAVARSGGLPPQIPLIAPGVFLGWFLVFLIRWALTEYTMDDESVVSRRFDWARLSVASRRVPIDEVQGVETERNGWSRRLLGYGTVVVNTSAIEGELRLADVNGPEMITEAIRDAKRSVAARHEGRERMNMRRMLEKSGASGPVPEMIRSSSLSGPGANDGGETRIRKSPAVLIGNLILPILAAAAVLVLAKFSSARVDWDRRLVAAALIPPLAWGLYRFEDWRNDSFKIVGGYVVDLYRKPLGLKQTRRQIDLASIQNIRTEQKGLASFLFRYGDVVLVTAGGASDTILENVARPWRIQDLLFRRRENEIRRREEDDRIRARDDMVRFVEALDQIRPTGSSPT